jgi:hypothetical protein
MGWRFRKSIGGKYFRVNLGRHGVTSTTFGKRGMPHVTVGKGGTRIGAAVPGTGLYYSQRIDDRATAQFPVTAPTQQTSAQTSALPPNIPPTHPSTPPDGGQLPWSKLVIASFILGLIGLVLSFTPAAALGALAGFTAFFLGLAGLIVIATRKRRRSILAACLSVALALVTFVVGAVNMPESTSTASTSTSTSSDATSRSAGTSARARKAAAEKKAREEKKAQKEEAEKLDAAKTALGGKITEAHTLLDSSNNNVADPQTRLALTDAINAAAAVSSTNPQAYTNAVEPLQTAMDTVNASVQQKKQNDAAAAQAAAQAQQQQQASGSLIAVCRDGTQSQSAPGAPDYRGMCSHRHGIAQKLGRR